MAEDTNPDEMWEAHRRDAFRTFRVYMLDLTVESVFTHFWDNTTGAGHWNFYTIEPSGRKTITRAYGCNHVWKVEEVKDFRTDRAFVQMAQVEDVKTGGVQKKSPKEVH